MGNTKIYKAVRSAGFDELDENNKKRYAVVLDVHDSDLNYVEQGTEWRYFSEEEYAFDFINEFNEIMFIKDRQLINMFKRRATSRCKVNINSFILYFSAFIDLTDLAYVKQTLELMIHQHETYTERDLQEVAEFHRYISEIEKVGDVGTESSDLVALYFGRKECYFMKESELMEQRLNDMIKNYHNIIN